MAVTFTKINQGDIPHRIKWLNDPEVSQYLGHRVRIGTDEKFHQEWFAKYKTDKSREIFTIKADGKKIGQVGLLDINLLDKNASLYIMIGEKDYWQKGFGTKALEFILDYGFNELKLHKIWLDVHAENLPAIKLYQKFGFTEEGRFKDQIRHGDKFTTELRLAKINPY